MDKTTLLHLQDGKMLFAIESRFTCLTTVPRTPLVTALSKTSTNQTRHNFLMKYHYG